ncbi:undecaprenol kinase [Saccharococcus thermophilus]|uniref:Undecaprenol kinase n=2 Tax=Saccharococcus thermophilus TaxID=29396 RepID=A0A846MF02_9BACL|nr:undecaprenol kinase [Saccharococcus thermophilus]
MTAMKEEAHMRVHIALAVIVIVAAVIVHISKWEWLVLLLTIGSVITLELINTAIERAVNLVTTDFHPLAKAAKDIAAAAVLFAAIVAVIIGIIIFLPHVI